MCVGGGGGGGGGGGRGEMSKSGNVRGQRGHGRKYYRGWWGGRKLRGRRCRGRRNHIVRFDEDRERSNCGMEVTKLKEALEGRKRLGMLYSYRRERERL